MEHEFQTVDLCNLAQGEDFAIHRSNDVLILQRGGVPVALRPLCLPKLLPCGIPACRHACG
jgi:hypothetical protein